MTTPAAKRWRLIDTGLLKAPQNIAINRAMLEAHQALGGPHTLRFLRFRPSALIGFHQSVEQELRVDYCRSNGIEIQRRVTGGGAIYFDPGQLGWELYLDRKALAGADMENIARRICEAAATGIQALGVDARFRPRNDIEVDGRKISGTGGVFEGDSFLYQGTLLLDFDVERMLRVLRIPTEKLLDKAIDSARQRVTSLKELLGEIPPLERVQQTLAEAFSSAFSVDFEKVDALGEFEQEKYRQALVEIDTEDWINQTVAPKSDASLLDGIHRCNGGLLRASVALDRGRSLIKQVCITGDFFLEPKRMVVDLEATLKDTPVAKLDAKVLGFFQQYPARMLMLQPEDFVAVIRSALSQTG
jgi:lipoate-protein ligase A